jgi:hypothetical protein
MLPCTKVHQIFQNNMAFLQKNTSTFILILIGKSKHATTIGPYQIDLFMHLFLLEDWCFHFCVLNGLKQTLLKYHLS